MKVTHEPPLRFYRDKPWSLFRLKELGDFKSGVGFSENQQGGKEGTPFFKVSDMNLRGNEQAMLTANHYVTADQIKKNGYRPITTKAILFAKVGAAIFHERKRIAQDFLMDNNMMAFLPSDLPIDFTKHLFDRVRLSKYAQVGALPSYNASDIGALKVHIPDLPEQRKIADFLTAVDGRIGQLSQKKALLEDYKKGVMQQLFTQALRFKDDQGNDFPAWEEKKFTDVLETTSPRGFQIQSSEILPEGRFKVVDQGKALIAGYCDDSEKVMRTCPVIVYGDHTTIIKYVDFEFVVGADGTQILVSKEPRNDLKYLYYNLSQNNVSQEGYKRHFSILKGILMQIPSPEEQTKIANFLTALDRKIESVTQQITHTKTFKKGLLQQMFV
jgi:type I restriction enzyme S subunit